MLTGVTEHNAVTSGAYTYKLRPVELVWYQDFQDPNQANCFEKKIKKWEQS
jgi:putative endonuclease